MKQTQECPFIILTSLLGGEFSGCRVGVRMGRFGTQIA